MKTLSILIFLVSHITLIFAKDRTYKGCEWGRTSIERARCDLRGASYKGVAVRPEFVSQPKDNFTAEDMCEFACADNINCASYSFYRLNNNCQLYAKRVSEIGFEPQRDSKRFYSDRICTTGKPKTCGKNGKNIFYTSFDDGPGFRMTPSQSGPAGGGGYWNLGGPPRCHVDSGDRALFVRAPHDSSISMAKTLPLDKIGGTYELTFDYLYEDYDPANIIFGILYQTDKKGGISQVFELARADDPDKVDTWQRHRSTFITDRTKKYEIRIFFQFIPGMAVETRVRWRVDNVCLVQA